MLTPMPVLALFSGSKQPHHHQIPKAISMLEFPMERYGRSLLHEADPELAAEAEFMFDHDEPMLGLMSLVSMLDDRVEQIPQDVLQDLRISCETGEHWRTELAASAPKVARKLKFLAAATEDDEKDC